jgi:hypothetical protein
MSQISIFDWITAFLIVVPLFSLIISIPSFIAMYKLGFKAYVEQLVLLKTIFKKISTGYKINQNQVYSYTGVNPKKFTQVESSHFFPIIINKDTILVINKKEGPFSLLDIQYCKNEIDIWDNYIVNIKTSTCLFTQILNDRLQKKVDNLMKESIQLDDVENLNQLLNSEITSIKREDKLKSLLDD